MVRDEIERKSNENRSTDDSATGEDAHADGESSAVGRRNYLKLAGAGAAVLGGASLGTSASASVSEGGPEQTSDWQLLFEDSFESGSLDTSKWGIGFGWGRETNGSPERIVDENVTISDGKLRLAGTHDGDDYKAGSVHTKGKAYFGPGTYWEAKIKMPARVGFLPAFWAKPNDESWPPEIDFVELFQTDGSESDTHTSHHHIHYSSSTEVGDSSTHEDEPASYDAGTDLTSDFHIYGCEWLEDRVVHYVDGVKVAECTDSTIMSSLNKGAPFYMMLNIHIDRVGTADASETWGEELVADWVRVWEYAPDQNTSDDTSTSDDTDSTDNTSDSTDSTDDTSTSDNTEHYLWVRSADGSKATYEFEASGGNIRIDPNEQDSGEDDEWIADDGMTAGGEVSGGSLDGDGFWFIGEITDLQYSGPLEMYVDDQQVDPDSYVSSTSDSGSEDTSDSDTEDTSDSGTEDTSDSGSDDTSDSGSEDTSSDSGDEDTSDSSAEDTSDGTEHYLWVRSADGSKATYAFEASGGNIRIDPNEQDSGEDDEWIAGDGMTAGGEVSGGSLDGDGFWFTGEITDLQYSGPLETYVDDQAVDPDSLVDSSKPGPMETSESKELLPNTITIDGSNSSGVASYALSVSDEIQATDFVNPWDTVGDQTAEGQVGGGKDRYRFTGRITELSLDGDAEIYVNGTRVDLLTIDRTPDSNDMVMYLIETTGRLLEADVQTASIESTDDVRGEKAFGSVRDDTDAYWLFDGNIVDVSTFAGDVVTHVNGTEVDHTD